MVCVAHESRCECIVRDPAKNMAKYEVTLPSTTSVSELISLVSTNMKYEPHSFQLALQHASEMKTLTAQTIGSLESAGLSSEKRNNFLLEGIGGHKKNLVAKPPSADDTNATSPPPPELINFHMPPSLRPATASPASDYSFSSPLIRHETGFVGLVNQAMTCYLNSMLQALYMTPEFRNALYKWQYDPSHSSSQDKCIPFQLQKLFLNLQTSSKPAVETTELTRSFGWESGEVWQQHDIQELCRVMFDALEQEFKDTEQADLINQLYQGKMIDYVKCLECSTEKSREDTFLDIPLPVRPFGSTIAYGSVQEALKAFVQPETLEGNNQYLCDKCGKKCDAHKGLKFTKFPYILTLHLKRFDFDYSTMHRIKLNDKLVFPDILDLNGFVKSASETTLSEVSVKNEDVSATDVVQDEDMINSAESYNNEVDQDEDEGIDLNPGNNLENEKNRQQNATCGPFLYELYSIMIHSGSASGGHYYAYIRDFAKNEWYCFNDQSVTPITREDIKKTYGGSGGSTRGYYSGAYSSSTNAYMLMYRQINKEVNCFAMVEEEFPQHIKILLEKLKEAEEREKAMRAKQEEMVRMKLYANHPILGQPRSNKIFCSCDITLKEVKDLAYSQLKLEDVVPEEQCRLVIYDKTQDEMEESLDGRENELVKDIFTNKFHTYELLMEIREKNAKFLPYNLGDIRFTVYIYDMEEGGVVGPQEIRTSPCQSLSDLKKLLQSHIPLRSDDVHVVLVKSSALEYISKDEVPLNKQGFSGGNFKIFICYKGPEGDLSENFSESDLYKNLDEVKNVITLQISVPDTKKETLKLLLIPPLDDLDGDKPSDSTPTGDGAPLMNGVPEEEVGCGSVAGCTSDQSTSEDSSLTDSDRTIIGEVVNECPLASPIDPDQPFPSSDSQPFGQTAQVIGEHKRLELEGLEKSLQMNGESKVWDEGPHYYFRATPYFSEEGHKMLRLVVDKSIDIFVLKQKLERYIGVESKFIKLLRGSEGQEISCSLRSCKDDEKVTIKLERVLDIGEHRIAVNFLNPNSSSPVLHMFDWIVTDGESIASLKKAILKEAKKRASLDLPYERCRLRKQNLKNPGAVLLDSDVWEEIYRGAHQNVYLQELEGPDSVTNSKQILLFARRWYTDKNYLGPFEEIVIDSSQPCNICVKLSELSEIPAENVKFAKGKIAFPAESRSQVSDLYWETDLNLIHEGSIENGTVLFYRDDREEMRNSPKEEAESTQETTNTNTFSYISGYSPRKERALKIYLDTPPRRTRSVIDVD